MLYFYGIKYEYVCIIIIIILQCLQKCVFPLYVDVFWTGSNSLDLDHVIIYP